MTNVYVVADADSDGDPCVFAAYTERWRADLHAMEVRTFVIEAPLFVGDDDYECEPSCAT